MSKRYSEHRPFFTHLPPLSLYIHFPWCLSKCPYCDFNSHEAPSEIPEHAYLDALRSDLEQALPMIRGRTVISIFLGGGTPSLLSNSAIDKLLGMLYSSLNLNSYTEVTLEANPGAIDMSRFHDYARSGINRFSLGVQSFNNTHLKKLGRIHNAAESRLAISRIQKTLKCVNLDIMFALPGQTIDDFSEDLKEAVDFGTDHLSIYNLTLEPNTFFAKYPPTLPDEDTVASMQRVIEKTLEHHNLEHYEVSAYSKPGYRCQHNLNYWRFGDYLGIGPGAHSKLSFDNRVERSVRLRNPTSWIKCSLKRDGTHIVQRKKVRDSDLPFEFMLNTLRLKKGVPTAMFNKRTGLPLSVVKHQLKEAYARSLLKPYLSRLQSTPLGWRFLNELQLIFLSN